MNRFAAPMRNRTDFRDGGLTTPELLPKGETLRVNEWEVALTALLGGFMILLGLVLLFASPGSTSNLRGPWRPILGLVGIGWGGYMALGARSGLTVEDGGVTVQGVIRRRHWSWNEIEKFELAPAGYLPLLRIRLKDGKRVRASGFKGRNQSERDVAQRRVAELNRRAEG
ncbi:MAG TPA: PH domain-containing protein [Solirubrobacterales bacterium]